MVNTGKNIGLCLIALILLNVFPVAAFAADSALDTGDTAWIITATVLVLFMTMPGLALFYGGLVRSQHVLSVLMHCMAIACIASILWLVCVYSLAFGEGGSLVGDFSKAFLSGITMSSESGTIPEGVFFMFQMTFAIITPGLIVGAFPERVKFSAVMWFSSLWLILVYAPVCHWVWGGGWLAKMGVLDFAGGLVVHATAGVSALVFAKMLGKRKGFPSDLRPPHSPSMTMIGACMLWVGWFGFNGGSALAADGTAGYAIVVTHISAATASLVWMSIEWIKFGKPSLVGLVTGSIAGLATITPGSGFVGPIGGLIYGLLAGSVCFFAVQFVRNKLMIDDSLDVFAVHGVGGMMGTLLAAIFASKSLGGAGLAEGVTIGSQFGVQAIGVIATLAWSVIASVIILLVVKRMVGLRVDAEAEETGLDTTSHGESAYEY